MSPSKRPSKSPAPKPSRSGKSPSVNRASLSSVLNHPASPPRLSNRRAIRRPARRRPGLRLAARLSLTALVSCAALLLWSALSRAYAPISNTPRSTFDAILVLGSPADSDGNPTPQLLDRVTEAVHEYEHGVAPRIILSGAAAHNQFVEAEVMSRVAHAQGIPNSAIFEETHALDTIQNLCYSSAILRAHNWHSVEVVSSPSHLPRAALILSNLAHTPGSPIQQWRMHAAPNNRTPSFYSTGATQVEVLKTLRYLTWTRWTESCTP